MSDRWVTDGGQPLPAHSKAAANLLGDAEARHAEEVIAAARERERLAKGREPAPPRPPAQPQLAPLAERVRRGRARAEAAAKESGWRG